jgi:ASC-1-like (ASCH) protein
MESKEAIIEVENPWFTFLRTGLKTVEGKKANEKWSKIKVGDLVNIVNSKKKDEAFQMKVEKLNKYKTIEEYLEKEGLA